MLEYITFILLRHTNFICIFPTGSQSHCKWSKRSSLFDTLHNQYKYLLCSPCIFLDNLVNVAALTHGATCSASLTTPDGSAGCQHAIDGHLSDKTVWISAQQTNFWINVNSYMHYFITALHNFNLSSTYSIIKHDPIL